MLDLLIRNTFIATYRMVKQLLNVLMFSCMFA